MIWLLSHVKKNFRPELAPWYLVAVGLCAMYGPSFYDLFHGIWATSDQGYGPIVFGISIWLIYRKRAIFSLEPSDKPAPTSAWIFFSIGLLLYILGRSQDVLVCEIGSISFLAAAVVLALRGWRALGSVWFPVFFMLFMVPLPGAIVDAITMPMKMAVSYVAEETLYSIGYPIARLGVMLQIGQYKLMVADACAGLHTLFTLEALGLVYLSITHHDSVIRNMFLAILIMPISFSANVIRVMALTLITYHFGDEAGQGFLHGFAGMVLFLTALMLIIATDSFLQFGVGLIQRHKQQQGGTVI